ncbi:hypothetical protein C8Q76DRAFT_571098, partial [Earliella scabrosa]
VNRTIDDEYGDSVTGERPRYDPPDRNWAQGQTCQPCTVHLDPSQVFNGTWHDATAQPARIDDPNPRTITMSFKGTAVYVYNVLANTTGGKPRNTTLEFRVDGVLDGNFAHAPNSSPDLEYHVLVYSNENLSDSVHTLEIRTVVDQFPSLVLFDYVIYT